MQQQSRIGFLVAAHLACTGLLLVLILCEIPFSALNYVVFIITSSQFSLLSIWIAFGGGSSKKRFLLAFSYATFLVFLRAIGPLYAGGQSFELRFLDDLIFLIGPIAFNRLGRFLIVCIILITLRHSIVCIDRKQTGTTEPFTHRFQFGLWHLMIATVVMCVLVTIGKQIYGFFGQAMESILNDPILFLFYHLNFLCVGLLYSLSIVSLSVWAVLGNHRPNLPVVGALLFAAAISPIWPLLSQQPTEGFSVQAMVTVYQMLVVAGSLLVVRSCGYRLLRLPTIKQEAPTQ